MSMFHILLTGLLLAGLSGCGGSGEANVSLQPVSGVVVANGTPLAGAVVTFTPYGQQIGKPAYGTTDANGMYELTFVDGRPGCPPGNYLVTISKFAKPDGSPFSAEMPQEEQMAVGVEHIPSHFSDATKTKLLAEVPADGGTFPFEVSLKKK